MGAGHNLTVGYTAGMSGAKPLLALTIGDPGGIGPEIVYASLTDPRALGTARLCVLGPASLRPSSVPEVPDPQAISECGWVSTAELDPGSELVIGQASAAGGQVALAALRKGAELALAGEVDGLVTAPVSKESLHFAGESVEGQTSLLERWAGSSVAGKVEMLAIAHRLRVLLLTRHMATAEALSRIDSDTVLDRLRLLAQHLPGIGIPSPRIALAGVNPHAGEGGRFGNEEIEILGPAVSRARGEGINVVGPLPPDTVFLRGAEGEFDAVLALYHDQGFIPVKLHAPREALTLLLGLPYLRISPAHGTAFDIAGQGKADATNLIRAVELAAQLVRRRAGSQPSGVSSLASARA